MSGHTPGPWAYSPTAGDHDFSVYPEQGNGRDVALVREFNEANARLIAAAPELLDALTLAYDALRECSEEAGDVDRWNEGGIGYSACRAARELLARVGL